MSRKRLAREKWWGMPRRNTPAPRRRLLTETLEDRILYDAVPVVTINAPGSVGVGETVQVTVSFDNQPVVGPNSDTGFGPWIDVAINRTGTDGLSPGVDPVDAYDGLSLLNPPTYLGTPVTYSLLTLDDTANNGFGVLHPYAVDASGNPVFISTTDITSPYFALLNGSFTNGDQLLVIELPFGSFTPNQPAADINFSLQLSDLADVGVPLPISAWGGFRFGFDALNNPATDPSIIGNAAFQTTNVDITLATLTKTFDGPEGETATGPNFLRTYRINVDIAPGQTLEDLHIFDELSDRVQFVSISGASHAFSLVQPLPSTTVPGGELGIVFDVPVTGSAWIEIEFYVPRLDANGDVILPGANGAFEIVQNQAYGYGSWTPLDVRDAPVRVGLNATVDPDLLNPPAAVPSAAFENTFTAKSIAIQKGVSIVADTGAPGATPGDTLEYSLNFQISDYFAFDNLVVTDTFSDGQRFDATYGVFLEVNGNTFALANLLFDVSNYTVSQNFTGAVAAGNLVINPAPNDGTTTITFRLSDEIIRRAIAEAITSPDALAGRLLGGGVDPSNPTPNIANPLTGYNDGPTTGRIVFRTVIQDKFSDDFPSGEDSVNSRDALDNAVTVTGNVLALAPGFATSFVGRSDGSGAGVTIVEGELSKSIYAINGSTDLTAFTDGNGNINLSPGDTITYRLRYEVPSGDVEQFRFTDYLPLPVLAAGEVVTFAAGAPNALAPLAGQAKYGPGHTMHIIPGGVSLPDPTITTDAASNSINFFFGDADDPNNIPRVVDLLFTVTVRDDPFADALFLTNQVQSGERSTQEPAVESNANAIVQIVLAQPNVRVLKGVVGFEDVGFGFGNVQFSNPTVASTISGGPLSTAVATQIGDNDETRGLVDSGDVIRFAVILENSGGSDAFDVQIRDTIPTAYTAPLSAATFAGDVNLTVIRGDGTILTVGQLIDSSVRVATTGDLASFSGISRVIDGLTLNNGDRVLVKDQVSQAQNGIYVVSGASGSTMNLVRATDFDQPSEITVGYSVSVLGGTVNANRHFTQSAVVATVGTDPIVWGNTTAVGIQYFYSYDPTIRTFGVLLADTFNEGDPSDAKSGGINRARDGQGNPILNGFNFIVVTYDLVLNSTAEARTNITNTVALTQYAGTDGGPDHVAADRTDTAIVTPRAPTFEKILAGSEVINVDNFARVATSAPLGGAAYNPAGGSGGTGSFTAAPTVVDGITLQAGDIVLVKDQADARQNGLYRVTATTSVWERHNSFDSNPEIVSGYTVMVTQGAHAGAVFGQQTNAVTLNTSNIVWTGLNEFNNSGFRWDTVTAIATANIAGYLATGGPAGTGSIINAPGVVDGVQLKIGDRILVVGQADASQNGIYEVVPLASFDTGATVYSLVGGLVFAPTAGGAGSGQHRGTALVVDGVTLSEGNIVLVNSVTNTERNGIYIVSGQVDGTVAAVTNGVLAGVTFFAGGLTEDGQTNGRFVGATGTIDGVSLAHGQRFLVKDQADATQNGVYVAISSDSLVRAATTANLAGFSAGTFTGISSTVDGVALTVGSRVLVKDQIDAAQNGIYVVTAVGGGLANLARATDFDSSAEMVGGYVVSVLQGSQSGQRFVLSNNVVTVNTSAVNWAGTTGFVLMRASDFDQAGDFLVGGLAGKIVQVNGGGQAGLRFVTTATPTFGTTNITWTQTAGHWDRVDYFDDFASEFPLAQRIRIQEGAANAGAYYDLTSGFVGTINVNAITFERNAGEWVRASDADVSAELMAGRTITATSGTLAGTSYKLTNGGVVLNDPTNGDMNWVVTAAGGNSATSAVIGESLTYVIRVEVPEGTTQGLRITDVLPANLAFQELVSITTSSGAVSITANAPGTGPTPANVTYDHGTRTLVIGNSTMTVVNTDTNNATVEYLYFAVRAVVLNSNTSPVPTGNQAGVSFANPATLSYTYNGGTQNGLVNRTSTPVDVIEPVLVISNQLSYDGITWTNDLSVDAGDTVFYRIIIENPGELWANDISIYDRLPTVFDISQTNIVSVTSSFSGTHFDTAAAAGFDDFEIVTDTKFGVNKPALQVTASGANRDFAPLETLTIVLQSRIVTTIVSDSTHPNGIEVKWTSLNDDVRSADTDKAGMPGGNHLATDPTPISRSIHAANAVERTGEDSVGPDATTLNNYAARATVPTTLRAYPINEFVKTLVGTSVTTEPGNNNTQGVIGEIVTYTVSFRVPEGVTNNLVLTDVLDNGLGFVTFTGLSIAPNISTSTGLSSASNAATLNAQIGSEVTYNHGTRTLTINFGTVTNANNNDNSPPPVVFSPGQEIVLTYQAVILNVAGNQQNTLLNNIVTASYETTSGPDEDANVTTLNSTLSDSADQVTVVEPSLTTLKDVALETVFGSGIPGPYGPSISGVDAGDVVFYRIRIESPAVGNTTAFDVSLSDPFPAEFGSPAFYSVTSTGNIRINGVLGAVNATHFQISGGLLTVAPGVNLDIEPGATIEIVVSGAIVASVGPEIDFINTATTRWSSLDSPGNTNTPVENLSPNIADGTDRERTGAGGVDDYISTSTTAGVIITPLLAEKSIVATSETHTTGTNVAVGEIIRYRLAVRIPEGTLNNFQIRDQLPPGLVFLNDGTARIAFVSDSGVITSSAAGLSGAGLNIVGSSSAVSPTFVLPGGLIAEENPGGGFIDGEDVFFNLGTIVNTTDNDLNNEYVVIEFNALVLNNAALATGTLTTVYLNDTANDTTVTDGDGTEGIWRPAQTGLAVSVPGGTNNPDELIASGDSYRIVPGGNNRAAVVTFGANTTTPDAAATLAVGESLRLSFDFRFESVVNSSQNFRFGIYNNGGTPGSATDAASVYDNDRGYGVQLRTGSASANTSRFFVESGAVNSTMMNGSDVEQLATFSFNINDTNAHNATFELVRTSATQMLLRVYVDGALVSSATHNESVARPLVTTFHEAVFGVGGSSFNFRLDNVSVTKQHIYSNTFTASVDNGNPVTSAPVTATLVEPRLRMTQGVAVTGTADSGAPVTYTLTIAHETFSGADAFGLNIADLLPSGFTPSGFTASIAVAGDQNANFNLTGNNFTTTGVVNLAQGQTLTIVITGALNDTVTAGSSIQNPATVTWTSLPGTGTVGGTNTTGSSTPGASGADNGERTGAGGVNYYARHSTSFITVITPTIEKRFFENNATADAGSSIPTLTPASQVAIGESVLYDLRVTLPEGTTNNLRIEDLVPAGMRIDTTFNTIGYQIITTAAASGGQLANDFAGTLTLGSTTAIGGTLGNVGVGQRFTFSSAIATGDNANNNTFVIRLRLIVADVPANTLGVTQANTGRLLYDNPNPPPTATVPDPDPINNITITAVTTPTVTIVEPLLSITKAFATTPTDAGDTFAYDITISNAAGANRGPAFDINLLDQLAAQLSLAAITDVTIQTNPGYVSIDTNASSTGAGALVNITLNRLMAGDSVTVRITGTVNYTAEVSQTISNSGQITYTTTPGVNPDERTYNPVVSNTVSFTLPATTSTKAIVATSEASTAGNDLTIGEIVRYSLTVTLPEGTAPDLSIVDILPTGLQFLNDGTTTITFTGLADGALNPFSTIALLAGANTGVISLDGSLINVAGQTLTFNLGSITNNDNDLNTESIVIEFNALVLNTADNNAGNTKDNNFVTRLNGVQNGASSNTVTVNIVEPNLTVNKVVHSAPVNPDAGDLITYRVSVANTGSATAFNANFLDTLLDGLTLVGGTLAHISGTDITSSLNLVDGASTLTTIAGGFSLAAGATTTFEYQVRIPNTVVDNQVLDNTALITWTSLPGTGTVGNPTGSNTPGVSGSGTGERDGSGGVNDYTASDSETVTANLLYALDKSVFTTSAGHTAGSALAIGETVTFRITATLGEGTTNNLVITDTLPFTALVGNALGVLTFESASLVSVGANVTGASVGTPTITNSGANNEIVTFQFGDVVVTGTNGSAAAGARQIVIEVVARAANVLPNQSGDSLTNTAQMTSTEGDTLSDTAIVSVVEPVLALTHSIPAGAGYDAGDSFTITLTIDHTVGSNANAFDILLTNALPAVFDLTGFTIFHHPSVNPFPNIDLAADTVEIFFDTLATSLIPITVELNVTLRDSITPSTLYTALANLTWTSLPGVDAAERTGADGIGPDNTTLNNYAAVAAASLTTSGALTVNKTVSATSQASTTGNNVAIGEIVTYQIQVTVFEGTSTVTLVDTLPPGLEFVANSGSLTTPGGWTISGFNTNSLSQVLTITNPGASDATALVGDTATGTFTYTYQALVANVAANTDAAGKTNTITATGPGLTPTDDTETVTVREPMVNVTKNTVVTGTDGGDPVQYTITITNSALASASAFDLRILDTLDPSIQLTSALIGVGEGIQVTGAGVLANASTVGQLDLLLDQLAPGDTITITLNAVVRANAVVGSTVANTAAASWSSLPGGLIGTDDGTNEERTGSGGGTNTYTSTVVSDPFVLATPTIAKSLFATSEPGTSGASIAIGETATYALLITLPEGLTPSLTITDLMPVGMTYISHSIVTAAAASGGLLLSDYNGTISLNSVTGSGNGVDVVFDFGDTTTASDNVTNNNSFVIFLEARMLNVLGNQNNDVRTNSGQIGYTNGTSGPATVTSNTVDVTVVEPRITVVKTVTSATTGLDAGDAVTYQIVLNNAAADGATSTAFDVTLADVLPAGLLIDSIGVPTLGGGATIKTALAGAGTGTLSGVFDIPVNGTVTITYTAILQDSVTPNLALTNDVNVRFTSLDGANANERTGADIADPEDNTPPDDNAVLNNYAVGSEVTVTTANPFAVTKTLAATNAAHTAGNNVAIGEVVTYQLDVTVMQGTTNNLQFVDTLPAGVLLDLGTVAIFDAAGMVITNFAASQVGQVLTITIDSVVNPGATNDPAAVNTGTFTIRYNATVQNVIGNQSGTDLVNDVDATATNVPPDNDNQVTITVVEPALVITKAHNDADRIVSPGQTLTYTITLQHTGVSNATAFDVALTDVIPAGLTLVPSSVNVSTTGVITGLANTSAGANINIAAASMELGATITITYQATVNLSVSPADIIDNNTRVTFTSLPGVDGGERTYEPDPGVEVFDADTDPRQDTERVVVGTASIADYVWFDVNGDGIQDANEVGIAGVRVFIDTNNTGVFNADVDPSVLTDANGQYIITGLAPGSYTVRIDTSTLPDGAFTVATFDLDGVGTPHTASVVLTDGQTRTDVDFGYRGTSAIGDLVWLDFNSDGVVNGLEPGIPGVTLNLIWDSNGNGIDAGDPIIATTTTGADGSYTFAGLLSGNYRVVVSDTGNVLADATATYDLDGTTVTPTGVATIAGLAVGATNNTADFGYRGASSIGDRVWNDLNGDGLQDAGEFGISGLTVNLYRDVNGDGLLDGGDLLIGTITTGVNGFYNFSGLIGDRYLVEIPSPPASATPTFDLDGIGTPNVAGLLLGSNQQLVTADFGYVGAASIGDYVWFDLNGNGVQDATEPPLAGVRVFIDIDGTGSFNALTDPQAITAADGSYSFTGLIAGTYTVIIDTTTLPNGAAPTWDRDDLLVAPNGQAVVALGATDNVTDADFGYNGPYTISGTSYHDLFKTGNFSVGDLGIGGVTIELIWDTNNDGVVDVGDYVIATTITAADGTYNFGNLIAGNYLIRETQPLGYGNGENGTNLIDVTVVNASVGNQDFGNTTGSIAGTVYRDDNNNALQDVGETGIAGVSITLEWSGADGIFGNADDRTITLLTDLNGNYIFDHTTVTTFFTNGNSNAGLLALGQYRIIQTQPAGFLDGAETLGNAATQGTIDEGAFVGFAGRGGADTMTGVQIGSGQDATGYLFGELNPASLSGAVFVDLNANGTFDSFESGLPGVTVTLTGTNDIGEVINTPIVTDAAGAYNFTNLRPGSYTITQTQPAGYNDGAETVGTGLSAPNNPGNASVNDVFGGISIVSVAAGNNTGLGYNFGELFAFNPVKSIVSTSAPTTLGSDVAIGEVIRYQLVVNVPYGILSDFQIHDQIPAGLRFLDDGTASVAYTGVGLSGGVAAGIIPPGSISNSTVGDNDVYLSGTDVFFKLGTVTNLGAGFGGETVTLEFNAIVVNELANQNGSVLGNTFSLRFDITGDNVSDEPPGNPTSNVENVTVVEPRVTVAKTVTSATTGLDAGDAVTYQIVLSNAAPAATATAFDVSLADVLPPGLLISNIDAPVLAGGASVKTALAGTGTGNLTGLFDIPVNGTVTITYTAILQNSVTPNLALTNDVNVFYTSLDGVVTGERDGSNVADPEDNTPPDDNGILNNYAVGSEVTITTANPFAVSKSIAATSEASTVGNNVAVGEVVTYQLDVTVMQGTTNNITLVDTIPVGVALNLGTVAVFDASGMTITDFVANQVGSVLTITIGSVVNPGATNDAAAVNTGTFTIRYTAVVQNVLTNQSAVTLTNSVNGSANDVPPDNDNTTTITVVEPVLTLTKTTVTAGADGGDPVVYDLVITNTGNATAFDILISDTLAASLELLAPGTALSFQGVPPGYATLDQAGNTSALVSTLLNQLNAGDSVTVRISAAVRADAVAGATVPNTATIAYTSLPGGDPNERTGIPADPINDYIISSTSTSFVLATPLLSKTLVATSETHTLGNNVAIGEVLTFDILVTLPEGVTQTLIVSDLLPDGMAWVGHSIVTTAADSTVLDFDYAGILPVPTVTSGTVSGQDVIFEFGNVTTASDNNTTNNSFVVRVLAVVVNEVANQSGVNLVNNANLIYTNGTTGTPTTVDSATTNTVSIVEPVLSVAKTITSATHAVDAGDTVSYQIVVTHTGASNADAFDLNLTDNLPAQLQGYTLVSASIGAVDVSALFNLSGGGVLSTTGTLNLAQGETLTLLLTGTVRDSVAPGTLINNTANLTYTSTPGPQGTGNATPGGSGTTFGERNGTGGVNDYADASSAPTITTAGAVAIDKLGDKTNAVIGEVVTYTITVTVAQGTTQIFINDVIPAGLGFNAGSAALTTPAGWTINGFNINSASQILTVTNPGTTNDPSTLHTGTFTFTYTTTVLNVAGNQAGTNLTNTATITADLDQDGTAGNDPGESANDNHTVTVFEPVLIIDKSVSDTTPHLNQTITYTVNIFNEDIATGATAYDLVLTDVIPANKLSTLNNIVVTTWNMNGTLATGDDVLISTLSAGIDYTIISGLTGWTIQLAELPENRRISVTYDATISSVPTNVLGPAGLFGGGDDSFTNTARVTWTSLPGPTPGERDGSGIPPVNDYNTSADQTVTVVGADLALVKNDFISTVVPGQTWTYTVTVTNNGTDTATGVVVTDILPAEVTLGTVRVNGTPTAVTPIAGGFTVALPNIAVGATVTVLVDVTLNPVVSIAYENLTNTARVNHDDIDPTSPDVVSPPYDDNADNDINVINAVPNIGVVKTATMVNGGAVPFNDEGLPVIRPGDLLTYTILVTNTGNQNALVTIVDTFPGVVLDLAGVVITDDSGVSPTVNVGGRTITWTNATLNVGQTITIVITARAFDPQLEALDNFLNTVAVTNTNINNPTENGLRVEDDELVDLDAFPDLVVTKVNSTTRIGLNDTFTYTIVVSNIGDQNAENVVIIDTLPNFIDFVSASGNFVYDQEARTVTWTSAGNPELVVIEGRGRQSVTFTITVTLPINRLIIGELSNTVRVFDDGTNGPDLNPSNNRAEARTGVLGFLFDRNNNFSIHPKFEIDDEWWYARPIDVYSMPILSLAPVYSGEAEPGSTLVIRLFNANGQEIGTQSVIVDAGGNWLATFPNSVIRDYPQTVVIQQTRASYNAVTDHGYNLRPYYGSAIHPGHFFDEQLDPSRIMSQTASVVVDAMGQALLEPIGFDVNKHSYEYLARPGLPSGY
jgi:uncharacterized repeat protein (TIGR01451 family)/fimbrial isopeptide formation D2 family protein